MATADSIEVSKEIQRRTGRNFNVATKLLPERVRDPTYVLYAFFRVADEVVDDPNPLPPAEQHKRLNQIEAEALGAQEPGDPVLSAFREMADRFEIADREIELFMDAMRMDVNAERYEQYSDLETYMRGSAVAVAYMMLAVMDPPEPEQARPPAHALGEAFQLTNFLRDVREDILDYGRVYLPQETLAAHDVSEKELSELVYSDQFAAVMQAELQRTEKLYHKGVAGIKYLPDDCQFGVLVAAVVYAEHHRLIRQREFDVLTERLTLTTANRLWLVVKTRIHWAWSRDPEATFYRVSAVSEPSEDGEYSDEDSPSRFIPRDLSFRRAVKAVRTRLREVFK